MVQIIEMYIIVQYLVLIGVYMIHVIFQYTLEQLEQLEQLDQLGRLGRLGILVALAVLDILAAPVALDILVALVIHAIPDQDHQGQNHQDQDQIHLKIHN